MNWGSILEQTVQSLFLPDTIVFVIAAIGLNIQFGYAGLLNFGQAGFMAAGAYGIAMTSHYFHVSMWWGFGIGLIFSVILGLLMGVPTLRLRADYLAIVTIAAAEIIRLVVRSQKFEAQFNGSDGITGFSDPYRELGSTFGIDGAKEYGFWWFTFTGRQLWTMIVGWILVGILALFLSQLMRSPWGRVLKAIREDEDAVRSLGKNVYSYKMQALIMGGIIGSIAGFVSALDGASVNGDYFSRDLTFYVLTALVLGGVASVTGTIVGPMIYWALYKFLDVTLRDAANNDAIRIGDTTLIQSTQIGQINYFIVGLTLVLLMIFRPQGAFGNRKEMAFDGR